MKFIERKFISVVITSRNYNPEIYDEQVVEKSSLLYFFALDPSNPQAAQLTYTKEQINLSDEFYGFGVY